MAVPETAWGAALYTDPGYTGMLAVLLLMLLVLGGVYLVMKYYSQDIHGYHANQDTHCYHDNAGAGLQSLPQMESGLQEPTSDLVSHPFYTAQRLQDTPEQHHEVAM